MYKTTEVFCFENKIFSVSIIRQFLIRKEVAAERIMSLAGIEKCDKGTLHQ
jgi:hypothetical protein